MSKLNHIFQFGQASRAPYVSLAAATLFQLKVIFLPLSSLFFRSSLKMDVRCFLLYNECTSPCFYQCGANTLAYRAGCWYVIPCFVLFPWLAIKFRSCRKLTILHCYLINCIERNVLSAALDREEASCFERVTTPTQLLNYFQLTPAEIKWMCDNKFPRGSRGSEAQNYVSKPFMASRSCNHPSRPWANKTR